MSTGGTNLFVKLSQPDFFKTQEVAIDSNGALSVKNKANLITKTLSLVESEAYKESKLVEVAKGIAQLAAKQPHLFRGKGVDIIRVTNNLHALKQKARGTKSEQQICTHLDSAIATATAQLNFNRFVVPAAKFMWTWTAKPLLNFGWNRVAKPVLQRGWGLVSRRFMTPAVAPVASGQAQPPPPKVEKKPGVKKASSATPQLQQRSNIFELQEMETTSDEDDDSDSEHFSSDRVIALIRKERHGSGESKAPIAPNEEEFVDAEVMKEENPFEMKEGEDTLFSPVQPKRRKDLTKFFGRDKIPTLTNRGKSDLSFEQPRRRKDLFKFFGEDAVPRLEEEFHDCDYVPPITESLPDAHGDDPLSKPKIGAAPQPAAAPAAPERKSEAPSIEPKSSLEEDLSFHFRFTDQDRLSQFVSQILLGPGDTASAGHQNGQYFVLIRYNEGNEQVFSYPTDKVIFSIPETSGAGDRKLVLADRKPSNQRQSSPPKSPRKGAATVTEEKKERKNPQPSSLPPLPSAPKPSHPASYPGPRPLPPATQPVRASDPVEVMLGIESSGEEEPKKSDPLAGFGGQAVNLNLDDVKAPPTIHDPSSPGAVSTDEVIDLFKDDNFDKAMNGPAPVSTPAKAEEKKVPKEPEESVAAHTDRRLAEAFRQLGV